MKFPSLDVMVEQQYEYIKSHTDLKVGKYQTDVTKQKDEFSKFVKDNNVCDLCMLFSSDAGCI